MSRSSQIIRIMRSSMVAVRARVQRFVSTATQFTSQLLPPSAE